MTDEIEIPDDVVADAINAVGEIGWPSKFKLTPELARTAGRVFVEWERGECAKLVEDCSIDENSVDTDDTDRAYAQARRHAAMDIRARSRKA